MLSEAGKQSRIIAVVGHEAPNAGLVRGAVASRAMLAGFVLLRQLSVRQQLLIVKIVSWSA